MPLTDTWLRTNNGKARDKVTEQTDRDGLSVRLLKKGAIVFQMRYRFGGKPARLDLGTYGENYTLAMARRECERMRALLEQGQNPSVVRRTEKLEAETELTLIDAFEVWYKKYCIANKKNHAEIKATFQLHVFPTLGKLPLSKIKLRLWLDLLEPLALIKPAIAERVLTNAKQLNKYYVKREALEYNVLSDIQAKEDLNIIDGVCERTLSDDEIALVIEAAIKSRMHPKNKLFVLLCLFFGCRNGELRIGEKKDFDFKNNTWTVPAERHKTGHKTKQSIVRPIIPEIKPFIKALFTFSPNSKYIVLNVNNDESEPLGRRATLSFPYNIMQWLRKNKKVNMEHWSIHDLRRTARTNFSAFAAPHVGDKMLGHKSPGERATYDKYEFLEEQTKAYKQWFDKLESLGYALDAILNACSSQR